MHKHLTKYRFFFYKFMATFFLNIILYQNELKFGEFKSCHSIAWRLVITEKKRLEKTIRNFNDWILRYDLRISNFDKSCLTPSRYSVLTLLVRLLVNCSKWRRVIRVFHCYRRGKQLCVKNYNYSTSQNYLKRKLIKLTNIYARRWRLHAPIKFF